MKERDPIRRMIAREAGRLMYEEGVREYRDAKRKAARRFGPEKALSLGSHLPSNAEIHAELRRLVELYEADVLPERLLALRLLALKYLELFDPFYPCLVGSVLNGLVREESDVDLHLFADSADEVENFLRRREMPYEFELVTVRKEGRIQEYPHIFITEDDTLIECTVYPPQDRHRAPKSSITGKPMERADAKQVRQLVAAMVAGGD